MTDKSLEASPQTGSPDPVSSPPSSRAHRWHRFWQRIWKRFDASGSPRPRPVIEAYGGYVDRYDLVLRGRVLSSLRRNCPAPEQTRWTNVKQMARLFFTREVADISIFTEGGTARSDAEGYFTLRVPCDINEARGWSSRTIWIDPDEPVAAPILVPDAQSSFIVISDIDDTVIRTGAYSLLRNLWTSFTGNALTREVFTDTAAFLRRCVALGAPIYYVSSSPWNLHHFLGAVMDGNAVPRGPLFLRDFGFTLETLPGLGHGRHKHDAIDTLLAAHPGRQAVLVGDLGQEDAAIYAQVAERWPNRIAGVRLRAPTAAHLARCEPALASLRANGVDVVAGQTLPDVDSIPTLTRTEPEPTEPKKE